MKLASSSLKSSTSLQFSTGLNPASEMPLEWFLQSGIIEPTNGVARYHFADRRQNAPVSTEITGYVVSALLDLAKRSGSLHALRQAAACGDYLAFSAWSVETKSMPFEPISPVLGAEAQNAGFTYFFDCGIIARALLRLGKVTGRDEFLYSAGIIADSMTRDFPCESGGYHPILSLPTRRPLDHGPRWSTAPGCYHLKAAMAWWELADAGEESFRAHYEKQLAYSLATFRDFFCCLVEPDDIMDRLHAFGYFLEGLLPVADRPEVRQALHEGIQTMATFLREVRHQFERSDVCAQLLRARLFAAGLGVVALDAESATEEAQWANEYCGSSEIPMERGFWFGRRRGQLTVHVNPVSTAFCAQALAMWQDFQKNGTLPTDYTELV
jgi:hypothetical protein